MAQRNTRDAFTDKVMGCLLGGLIGDAMGAPVEGWHYKQIEEKHGWVKDFSGDGTDDSAIKAILCEAIIASDGHVTADEFAESFLRNKDKYGHLFFIPVRNMLHKVEERLTLPVHAGWGNMQSSSSAMAISPMGIINACNPRQAALQTFDVAGLIHAGDSGFCRDGACAMAASVAAALCPDATVESVVSASFAYLHKTSAAELIGLIQRAIGWVKQTSDYAAFREHYYQSDAIRLVQCDSRETIPAALALFYLAGGDTTKTIEFAANFGRDADTIATMAGALAGAFRGAASMHPEWLAKFEQTGAMSKQQQLAAQLVNICRTKAQEQATFLRIYPN
ncbi:MAG: ADP-ribosylglycohydrolase family protein [Phycisphaerae bacterium]|nr:ADP-ribosylglycohydrolase family protein [Phycisphaerae bacterium]